MPRLKDRNRQIPEGHFFYVPETRWRSTPWASFDTIVTEVIQHRLGNPALAAKFNWSTDRATVENEVDSFNANVCLQMNWLNFVVDAGGAPPPKMKAPTASQLNSLLAAGAKAKQLFAGIKTNAEWLDAGAPSVDKALAESRAQVCVQCPMNGEGDFTTWFTKPAAAAIKKHVEMLQEKKLSTSVDEKLNICTACLCPMKLKVHMPLEIIKNHLSDEVLDELRKAPGCWIVKEIAI